MQRWKSFVVLAVTATVVTSLMVGTAVAAPDGDRRAEHQRIVDFWTPERVAQAIPRDFVLDPERGFIPAKKPDNPGKPGGDGGTEPDTGLVTGASWNGGGTVVNTTGKVLFQMGGSYYVCSASVVEDGPNDTDSVILTAAHCVYDESRGEFATNWMFVPAYDTDPAPLTTNGSFCGQTEYGCWTATALTVHSEFVTAGGFNDQAVVYDFAFATVGSGGHDGTALDALGTQAISFSEIGTDPETPIEVYSFGYPAAKKYKGNDLTYCKGPVANPPLNGDPTYRIECDMTGGSSGGPWFSGFDLASGTGTLVSVNSYGYRGDSGMYGPKFNEDTQALYSAADNAQPSEGQVIGG